MLGAKIAKVVFKKKSISILTLPVFNEHLRWLITEDTHNTDGKSKL